MAMCSDCPFRKDGKQVIISPDRRWERMKGMAENGVPMACHQTLTLEPIPPGGDWHMDAPVRVPCAGAATLRKVPT